MNKTRKELLEESAQLFDDYCYDCENRYKQTPCTICPIGKKISSIGYELIEETRQKRSEKGVFINIDECYNDHEVSSAHLWTEAEDRIIINYARIHGLAYGSGKKIAALLPRRKGAGVSRRISILKEKGLLPYDKCK